MAQPAGAWGWGRIAAYVAVIASIYVVAQIGAVIAAGLVQVILVPGFDVQQWAARADRDGVAVSAATMAAAMLCVPLVRILVGRHETAPWAFLGLRRVSGRSVALACGATLLFIAITDPINVWVLDRPLVPPFMTEAYATARKPAFLFVAIVFVAPFLEELLFRGFLFGVLRARGVPVGITVAVATVSFAVVHTQYDLPDMMSVVLIGLLLGWARVRFDSVLPSMAMHGLANAVAFVETMVVMRR